MSGRNWLFTINNPELNDYPEGWKTDNVKTLIYQVEQGEEGTIHLQGYLELQTPRQLEWIKAKLNQRAHWERRKGTRSQAILYCCKEETRLVHPRGWTSSVPTWTDLCSENLKSSLNSLGITLLQETRTSSNDSRLSEVKECLSKNSSTIEEIAEDYFDLWVRYHRAFEKYITMKTEPRNFKTEVHVLFGPTGTGKSKWCMDNYPVAYWKQRSKWWDGYFKHETVVMDEYYAWLPFDLLLRLCDRYPLLVESKGGQLQFVANTIIITTNKLPHEWYPLCYFPALRRRIKHWHYLPSLGIHAIYDTYEEFQNTIEGRVESI